eukprot:COSAG01_NODE_11302_length_1963_cov_2.207618_1_plen_448_part_00
MFAPPARKKGSRHSEAGSDGGGREREREPHLGYGQRRPGSQGRSRQPAREVVRWRCHFRNTVHDVFKSRKGWREMPRDEDGVYTDSMDWDICWSDRSWVAQNFDTMRLEEWQRVNHFRNNYELTRKDHMVKNLKRQKKQLEREGRLEEAANFDFFPTTYVVPQEYGLFYEEFKRNPSQVWIMKPIGRAQGKGIFLFTKLSQISDWKKTVKWRANAGQDEKEEEQVETYVAQRYVDNPYLIGGTKFDLRIYMLVTSFQPLTCWLYREGFARFSSVRFSMKKKDISSAFIHLTNVAVQKTADGYAEQANGEDGDTSKMTLRQLKLQIAARHGMAAAHAAFDEIEMVMIRSLLAVQKIMINDKHCFELYGYDVMLDDQLKAWLIEVNSSPSLSASSDSDYALKYALLEDTLRVVDLDRKLQGMACCRAARLASSVPLSLMYALPQAPRCK